MNENPAASSPRSVELSRRQRIRGCLLAGAVGDALGAPVEFLSHVQILQQFGPQGIRSFSQAYGRVGAITDDTQMSLFTAEAMIRASCQSPDLEQSIVERELSSTYLRWLGTQWAPDPTNTRALGERSGLFAIEALHALRAPGSTCISSLKAIARKGQRLENDSKGCGGVMRVAPIGLACGGTPEGARKAFHLGAAAAAITHGHPTGQLAAGALAMIVAYLVEGHTLQQALATVLLELSGHPDSRETTSALKNAMRLVASEPNSPKAVSALGEGWIAEEALAIAVYCALSAPDLPSALFLSVNHDGDSDSTGSITGNLAGCLYGQASIPQDFLQHLELRTVIEQIAEDLERLSEGVRSGGPTGANLDSPYTGHDPAHQRIGAPDASDVASNIAIHIAGSVGRDADADAREH